MRSAEEFIKEKYPALWASLEIHGHIELLQALGEYAAQQVKSVPYQCCPVCNGRGLVQSQFSSTGFDMCSVCEGRKIIPQFIIEKK